MVANTQLIRINREAKKALLLLVALREQDQTTVASQVILEAWRKEAKKIAEKLEAEELEEES